MKACLETTPAYFDGYFKINDGSMEKVDALLKFSRTSPLHGNFKLMVHEFLDSSAMYSLDPEIKGHGSVKFVRSNTELTGM